jgi:hypothetical protein
MEDSDEEDRLRDSQLLTLKQCYKPSSVVLTFFAGSAAVTSLNSDPPIALAVIISAVISNIWLPFLLKGAFPRHWKWATLNAVAMTLLVSLMMGSQALEFLETGASEGPHGEASPLSIILPMMWIALIFLCPWLLTALCGIRLWRQM